jgi:hypothetical protein
MHSPAATDRRYGGIHGAGQFGDDGGDGTGDPGVLGVHHPEDLTRAHGIDGERPGVALLSRRGHSSDVSFLLKDFQFCSSLTETIDCYSDPLSR